MKPLGVRLRALLTGVQDLPLECDGYARVVMGRLLRSSSIPTPIWMFGTVTDPLTGTSLSAHHWVEIGISPVEGNNDGFFIDFNQPLHFPHLRQPAICSPGKNCLLYVGEPVQYQKNSLLLESNTLESTNTNFRWSIIQS